MKSLLFCVWIGRLNTVKMTVLPSLIQGFNTTSIKILTDLLMDIDKLILKLYKNVYNLE